METLPVLIICGCEKYKDSLIKAVKRFDNDKYRVIGILGNPDQPTSYDEQILSLQAEDTYEALPLKIQAAFSWVYDNYPESPGVFKTDEDIYFKSYNSLAREIAKNIDIPYWGLKKSKTNAKPLSQSRIDTRYTNKTLKVRVQKAIYCYGQGYWVSRKAMGYLVKSKNFKLGSEDVLVGHVLNKHGIFPKEIKIESKEKKRTTVQSKIT